MEQKGVIAIEGKGKERNIELNKMKTFDDMLVQQLQDEEFKKNTKLFNRKWMKLELV